MIILFLVLIIIASVAMGLFILIQNPKGGGLAGSIAGFNTQFMGVKQTTDVLEKGTWVMAIAIALLCLFSTVFIPEGKATRGESINARPAAGAPAPNSGSPLQGPAQSK
ncbi:preprotein translocase subunit SecG [Niastella yeongjuensis]|uniref:Protein-export membrane protein SecG n=1 Tax=Niastella yeongjuensis TaxID=354355 RepID=A0A1V9E1E1_9BACT|nr:preprotein translocase subunit SecG [Niastella yeongjuensis]OQP39899.1 preprotein translocase subunit SecG [Niastella yeongjuensis]SEO09433.1 preprotein translocase subunit SecG [Niastella yeongjuensis]